MAHDEFEENWSFVIPNTSPLLYYSAYSSYFLSFMPVLSLLCFVLHKKDHGNGHPKGHIRLRKMPVFHWIFTVRPLSSYSLDTVELNERTAILGDGVRLMGQHTASFTLLIDDSDPILYPSSSEEESGDLVKKQNLDVGNHSLAFILTPSDENEDGLNGNGEGLYVDLIQVAVYNSNNNELRFFSPILCFELGWVERLMTVKL